VIEQDAIKNTVKLLDVEFKFKSLLEPEHWEYVNPAKTYQYSSEESLLKDKLEAYLVILNNIFSIIDKTYNPKIKKTDHVLKNLSEMIDKTKKEKKTLDENEKKTLIGDEIMPLMDDERMLFFDGEKLTSEMKDGKINQDDMAKVYTKEEMNRKDQNIDYGVNKSISCSNMEMKKLHYINESYKLYIAKEKHSYLNLLKVKGVYNISGHEKDVAKNIIDFYIKFLKEQLKLIKKVLEIEYI